MSSTNTASTRRRAARFNRTVANKIVGPVLTRMPGFGAVHHQGRKSGRAYRTPVKLFRRGDAYLISLPYGPESDWVRNVLAAGGCTLQTRRGRVRLTAPRILRGDGHQAVPAPIRAVLRRVGATEFMYLQPVSRWRSGVLTDERVNP